MSTERERLVARGAIRVGSEPRQQILSLPQRPRHLVKGDLDLHESPYAAAFAAILAVANAVCDESAKRRRP